MSKPSVRLHKVTTTATAILVSLRYPEEAYEKLDERYRLGTLHAETLKLANVTGIRDENRGIVTITDGEAHMDVYLGGAAILQILHEGDNAVMKRAHDLRAQVQQVLWRHAF